MNTAELKMNEQERQHWERVRRRGSMWYLVNKGLLFLLVLPAAGHFILGWRAEPVLLVEGWFAGLVCGGLVWMRKELRYRLTLDDDGLPVSDWGDE